MNWGWRIALFYGSFVVLIMTLVVLAFNQDFDLVAEDYYEQEVAYQERIDQMTNAADDHRTVDISMKGNACQLAFSGKAEEVKVLFFRTSDDTKDFKVEEAAVESVMSVPADRFIRGKYLVKVEWKANGKTYFQEKPLFVN